MSTTEQVLNSTERQDRSRVVTLLKQVGRERLLWSVYDLHRAQRAEPDRFRLRGSKRLSAHLTRLLNQASLIREIENPLAYEVWAGDTNDDIIRRPRRYFVLRDRYREFLTQNPIADLERAYLALWVACRAMGEERVPTLAVTRVLRSVEGLQLEVHRETTRHLRSLANRTYGVVAEHRAADRPRLRWEPVGPAPDHPDFDTWVEAFRATDFGGLHVLHAGHTTENDTAHELIRLAIRETRSSHWPSGRPVGIKDIRATIGDPENERAAQLAELLRRTNRDLGGVLADVSGRTVAGDRRVHERVVALRCSHASAKFYDVPDEPGFEHREVYPLYVDVKHLTSRAHLKELDRERRVIANLLDEDQPAALRAIGYARLVLRDRELEEIREVIHELAGRAGILSESVNRWLADRRGRLDRIYEPQGRSLRERRARELVAEFGYEHEEIIGASRPLLTPGEYAEWLSDRQLGDHSAAHFVASRRNLRTFDNPRFTKRGADDPLKAAPSCVDRAEALLYAAENSMAFTWSFLRGGKWLLGRCYRDLRLPRELLTCDDPRTRSAALAALTLLGDEAAAEHALQVIRDRKSAAQDVSNALYALLVLRRIDASEWPDWFKESRDPTIRRAFREVVPASADGRWVGQKR